MNWKALWRTISDKDVKQGIVVRTDLRMPVGKIAAQVAHASMSFLTRNLQRHLPDEHEEGFYGSPGVAHYGTPVFDNTFGSVNPFFNRSIQLDEEAAAWVDGAFTKVVVKIDNEEDLLSIYRAAKMYGCRASLIQDEGRTVFKGVPTYTCVAIGPNLNTKVDAVTKCLKLL
jgi:PTH2 family peptidyl-tRNA hydrolase